MLKAWKEMDGGFFFYVEMHLLVYVLTTPSPKGKYVGNRPIRLMKVQAQYGGTNKVTVGVRKAKELDKIAKNKGKPLNGRPTPW